MYLQLSQLKDSKHLGEVLVHQDGFRAFLDFCSSEFSSESLLFWKRVEVFRSLPALAMQRAPNLTLTSPNPEVRVSPKEDLLFQTQVPGAVGGAPITVQVSPQKRSISTIMQRHSSWRTPSNKTQHPAAVTKLHFQLVADLNVRLEEAKSIFTTYVCPGATFEVSHSHFHEYKASVG